MIKTKKGISSHLEVILSFIIFISFIMFIFFMFRPLKIFPRSESNLKVVSSKIIESIETDLAIVSLGLDHTFGSADYCMKIQYNLDDAGSSKIIIKNKSNHMTPAKSQGNRKFRFLGTNSSFYRLYSSDELRGNNLPDAGCVDLAEDDYTIGLARFYKKVSEKAINQFFIDYETKYSALRADLGIESHFNILLLDGSGEVLERHEKTSPQSAEVTAKNIPIEILNETADLKAYLLNIQVWD